MEVVSMVHEFVVERFILEEDWGKLLERTC